MGKIYCEVRSGLGNQLFQFAFGYALSVEFDKELVLCPSFFDSAWKYTIKKILKREARSFRLPYIINKRFDIIAQDDLTKKLTRDRIQILKEDEAGLQQITATLISPNEDVYLQGYWQNPLLFLNVREPLTNMITPSFRLSAPCRKLLDRIDENFVGIHVRRGDFLTNRSFGACTIDYYKQALREVSAIVNNPKIIVFTNDKNWVSSNFGNEIPYEIYENTDKNTDIEELYLLTKFKVLVIANSTFSWWGAYLNKTPGKYIISPALWFLKQELQRNVGNFNFKAWTVLNNQLELKQ